MKSTSVTDNSARGISWALVTYVRVGSLIRPRAGERDEFMAPLVDHETANCRGGQEQWRSENEGDGRESSRNTETDGEKRSVIRLKYSASLLTDMWADSSKGPRSGNTEKGLRT